MLVNYYRLSENEVINKEFEEGSIYLCSDSGRIYADPMGGKIRILMGESVTPPTIETGNWNPIIDSGIMVSYTASGCYYRVNNMVTISFTFEGTSVQETNDPPEIYITGIPYPCKPLNTWYAGGGHIQNYYTDSYNNYIFTGWAMDKDNIIRCRGVTLSGSHAYIKAGASKYIYGAGSITYEINDDSV